MENNPINLDDLMSKQEEVQQDAQTEVQDSNDSAQEEVQDNAQIEEESTTGQNDDQIDDLTEEEILESNKIVDEEDTTISNEPEAEEEVVETQEQESLLEDKQEFKDEFIKKVVDYYEKYGTLQPFLEATQVDYDEIGDTELLRRHFDKENSDLPEKTRNKLFEKELEKYNLNSFEDDDKEIGQALLKRDANKLRKVYKEEQQQFLNSISPQESVPQLSEAEIKAQQAAQRKTVEDNINKVVKDNFIKLNAGNEQLNFQLDNKKKIVDYALDSTAFLSSFVNDGNVDWDKWSKVVAFAENPTKFIDELIKHGKSLGKRTMESELKNSTIEKVSKDVQSLDDYSHPTENPDAFLDELRKFRK